MLDCYNKKTCQKKDLLKRKEKDHISTTETQSVYPDLMSFGLKTRAVVTSSHKQDPDPRKQFKCAIAALFVHSL